MGVSLLSRLTAVFLVALSLLAPIDAAGSGDESHLTSPSYAEEHWLPMSVVTALSEDAVGYLWVGTTSGLARFDGSQFVIWGTHSEHPLPADAISVVLAARDGGIWIGFMDVGGVSRIVNGELRNFGKDDGLHGGTIEALVEDHLGTIWAGGREGLASFRGERWEYVAPDRGLPKAS